MKKTEVTLVKLKGCVGCEKDCKWNMPTAYENKSRNTNQLYGCNSSLQRVLK